jgi:hypothetical protein
MKYEFKSSRSTEDYNLTLMSSGGWEIVYVGPAKNGYGWDVLWRRAVTQ